MLEIMATRLRPLHAVTGNLYHMYFDWWERQSCAAEVQALQENTDEPRKKRPMECYVIAPDIEDAIRVAKRAHPGEVVSFVNQYRYGLSRDWEPGITILISPKLNVVMLPSRTQRAVG